MQGEGPHGFPGMLETARGREGGIFRSCLERVKDFRNRKVADPAFRGWAARFFLTRRFARREARALFDLTAGFVYSQILAAAVRVRLFELLASGPLDVDTLALRMGLPPDGAIRLLKATAALRLTEPRGDGCFALGPLGAALVGNPAVTAMIAHHDMLYRDLADPLALLAGEGAGELGRYWTYAAGSRQGVDQADVRDPAAYTALMAASQALVTAEILGAYPLRRHRRLLDVGGGDGTFLIAAAKAAPDLQLSLIDLPSVAALARDKIRAAGISGRTTVFAGDFLRDRLPPGADLITLNRILHDHNDRDALDILRRIRTALAPAGTLLVTEPMACTPGAESSGDAYFGFYLLAMGQGRPRTAAEIAAMTRAAGFSRSAIVATNTPLIARMIAVS